MQITPERLDATRLLKVIDNIERGISTNRGQGRTLGFYYLMLQTICHDDHDTHYVYVGDDQRTVKNIVIDFADFLKQRGEMHDVLQHQDRIFVKEPNQTFDFVSFEKFTDSDFVRGMKFKKVFIDINVWRLTYQQWQKWNQTVQQVKCHNTELVG